MSLRSTFHRKADASWYREKHEEEWSPRSQESDPDPSFDSDEENYESNVISISTDSGSALSSLESPLPWAKNSSFSHPSPSTSLVLHSQANKVYHESDKRTELSKEYVPRSNSLVIGKRSRAIGLKDIDLTRNRTAKHIREAKEANKSPTKKHLFSPLSRHMSCPSFSTSIERPSDRQGETGKTGQTGLSRGLNFELDSQVKSPVVSSAAKKVAGKTSSNFVRLFSCPDDQGSIPVEESDCDWCEGHTTTTNPGVVQSSGKLCLKSAPKSVEVIDLTINEELSHRKVNNENKKSDYKRISERAYGDAGAQKTAGQNLLPVRKRVSKERSAFSFSDDEDSDSGGKSHLKSDQETPKEAAGADQESHKKTHSRQGFMKMCMFFTLCALLLSIYLHVNPHGFCLDSEFTKNISGIGLALKSELYGQHIAQKIVTAALKNHFNTRNIRKPLVLSFHGWTGIGKNFVSNIITEHFFKHKTHSPFVHKFIIPLHFPHESEVEIYNQQLLGWIQGNVSHCGKGGLFIFDEMDKIHPVMMDTVKAAILDYRGKKAETGYQNMIFIFLSNSGGEAINQHVLKHVLEGKLRESLTLSELEIIFHGIAKSMPNVWFADLLKSEVIDHLIPFLPLERTHVKQCIRRDLVKKGFHVKEALVTEIADQMEYFPKGHQFFSVSGCKKVSSRVDVVMG